MAADDINAKGGINGKKLAIDFQDHQCDPQTAITLFEQLNSVKGIKIFTSAACSGTVLALAPKLPAAKSLLLGTIVTTPKISGVSPYIFRNWASDDTEAKLLAENIKASGIRKLGIINEETDYAKGLRTSMEKYLGGSGIAIIAESFTPDAADVRSQLAKIKSENVDAIFLSPQTVTSGDRILKQMGDLNFKPASIFVNDNILKSTVLLSSYSSLLEGAISAEYVPDFQKSKSFLERYKLKYGECPQPNIGAGVYDAIGFLAEAIKENGYDADKVRDYLKSVAYDGITGKIIFDSNNDRSNADYTLYIIKNGKIEKLNK